VTCVLTPPRNVPLVLMACSDTSICIVKISVLRPMWEIQPTSFVNTRQKTLRIIWDVLRHSIETLILEPAQQFQSPFVKPMIKLLGNAQHVFSPIIYTKDSAMLAPIQQQQTFSWTPRTKYLKFAEKAKIMECDNVKTILLPSVETDVLLIVKWKTGLFAMEGLGQLLMFAFDQTCPNFFTLTSLIIIMQLLNSLKKSH